MPRIAAIQMLSVPERAANLTLAGELLAQAAAEGAALAILPEYFALFGLPEQERVKATETPGAGPVQDFLAATAARLGLWIVGGTTPLAGPEMPRSRAACLVFDKSGKPVARYDKMHLFDVEVADGTRRYAESEYTAPGSEPVVIDTPVGRLGLSVCYDIRFPELYRELSAAGAEVLAVPAAFTAATGAAHWALLMRARAVENLCFTVGATQWGRHANGRETYGHAMIVEPWGEIVAERADGNAVICADLNLARLREQRRKFPALAHRQL